MNITPLHPVSHGSSTPSAQINQEFITNFYRKRDSFFKIYTQNVDSSVHASHTNTSLVGSEITFESESNQDERILDPEKQDEEINDPKRDQPEPEFPDKEQDNEVDPKSPEEDNDISDDDGAIIKEPTRELDDPYRPGHADRNSSPPIEEEFPN